MRLGTTGTRSKKGHKPNLAAKKKRELYKTSRRLAHNKIRRIKRALKLADAKHGKFLAERLEIWSQQLRPAKAA